MKMYVVGEKRPWLPRHRASIYNERGQIVDSQTFWTKRAKDRWISDAQTDVVRKILLTMTG